MEALQVDPSDAAVPSEPGREEDQRVFLRDVSWEEYEAILAIRGEAPVPRIYYLEGDLELMSPSPDHEYIKKMIARLLEAYALALGLTFEAFGSTTWRSAPKKRGAEPDECYFVGKIGEQPDLALEVMWSRDGLDRLDIYRKLGVREVWIWRRGAILVHALRGETYQRVDKSELLPDLDLVLLAKFVRRERQTQAVREFLDAQRGARKPR